jgi:hypothetical protein
MNMFLARALLFGMTTATAGCAIVSSEHLSVGAGSTGEGIAYSLPAARVTLTLAASSGQLILTVGAPQLVADPAHHYTARRTSNPFSSDQVTVTVDPATGFLLSVSAVSKDETLSILETLLLRKEKPTAEAADDTGEEIYSTEVDPADVQELARETAALNRMLTAFLDAQVQGCNRGLQVCAEYASIRQRVPEIRLSGGVAGRPVAPDTVDTADTARPPKTAICSLGVCYRQSLPFMFKVALGDAERAVRMNIPNASPLIMVPLERHAFVTTTHALTFEQGVLKSATTDRPSSALALASSPLALVSGVIGSITKPLSELLKIDTSGQYQAKADEVKVKSEERAIVTDRVAQSPPQPGDAALPGKALAKLTLGRSFNTEGLSVGGAAPAVTPSTSPSGEPNARPPSPTLKSPGSSGTAGR